MYKNLFETLELTMNNNNHNNKASKSTDVTKVTSEEEIYDYDSSNHGPENVILPYDKLIKLYSNDEKGFEDYLSERRKNRCEVAEAENRQIYEDFSGKENDPASVKERDEILCDVQDILNQELSYINDMADRVSKTASDTGLPMDHHRNYDDTLSDSGSDAACDNPKIPSSSIGESSNVKNVTSGPSTSARQTPTEHIAELMECEPAEYFGGGDE